MSLLDLFNSMNVTIEEGNYPTSTEKKEEVKNVAPVQPTKEEAKENVPIGDALDDFDLNYQGEKAKETKKTGKESKAKAGEKKEKTKPDLDIKLPLTVYSTSFKLDVPGDGTIKISELAKRIYDAGYKEISFDKMNLSPVSDGTVVATINCYSHESAERDALVFNNENGVISVGAGDMRAELSPSDFKDKAVDEISAGDLMDRFAENASLWSTASFLIGDSVAMPYYANHMDAKTEVDLPAEVYVNGERVTLDDESIKTVADITKHFEIKGAENIRTNVSKASDGTLIVYYSDKKNIAYRKAVKKADKKEVKKVAVRYPLPLHVYIGTWGGTYDLTAADFDGKEKITEEDIKEYFGKQYAVFRDKDRKMDLYYDKDQSLLSIMFISGKKGGWEADMLPSFRCSR